jgi:hypothetical protein
MGRGSGNWSWLRGVVAVGMLGLLWAGCSGRSSLPSAPSASIPVSENGAQAAPPDPRDSEDYEPKPGTMRPKKGRRGCAPAYPFDRALFSNPTVIDNPYSPLRPGLQYTLEGRADRGGGPLPHQVVFTVTDVTKEIYGIQTVVLWDRDYNQGALAEEELAFFAQDDLGTIWSFGEYPEEFDFTSGEFQGAPSTWIVGIDGAQPGTFVLGDQRRGKGYYSQGYAPSVEFLDCASVVSTEYRTCVPVGCYTDVLLVDELGPYDPEGGHQRKYYARGVGNIRIGFIRDPEGEDLVMIDHRQLSPAELAQARVEALRLDARGFQFNDVYSQTIPAQ